MPVFRQKIHRRDVLFVALLALLAAALAFAPSGIENRVAPNAVPVRARILEVDNSGVSQFGIVKAGQQEATVRIESRRFKGREL